MTPRRFLPALLLLFVGSGCAALIYEVVWFQLLQLVIGSSAVSLGVLLGTFMGGMCLGSFLFARTISARHHPLRVYAYLELGIGLIGITLLMGATLPAMSRWVESTPEGVSWLGFFYGGNIGGGVIGCLLAGFYLLRVHDLAVATFVAIALNVAVALIGIAIAKAAPMVETL